MRLLLLAALGGYLVVLGMLTLTPADGQGGGLVSAVLDLLTEPPVSLPFALVEPALNVLLFVPLGLLGSALVVRRPRWWAVIGLAVSSAIELTQLLVPGRVTSASDLVANTTGALLGALASAAWTSRRGRSVGR